jgi:hypothetical protein
MSPISPQASVADGRCAAKRRPDCFYPLQLPLKLSKPLRSTVLNRISATVSDSTAPRSRRRRATRPTANKGNRQTLRNQHFANVSATSKENAVIEEYGGAATLLEVRLRARFS